MTISVIMPNYNHARFLPEALDAILSQSYPALEIVLVDDASKDESVAVIHRYCERYPQIKLYQNETNQGPVATINRAISYAKGDYLAFCAADDRVLPGFFATLIDFMVRHPEVGLCTSISRYFKESGSYRDDRCEALGGEERVITPKELVQILRTTSFYIPTQASLYRRDRVIEHGCLRSELKMASDLYLNYAIAFHSALGYVPQPLASFREVEGSYCVKIHRDKAQRNQVFEALLKMIRSESDMVQRYIKDSAFLALLGKNLFLFLLQTPRHWGCFSFPLMRKLGVLIRKKLVKSIDS